LDTFFFGFQTLIYAQEDMKIKKNDCSILGFRFLLPIQIQSLDIKNPKIESP
jgi:hypothetical protein